MSTYIEKETSLLEAMEKADYTLNGVTVKKNDFLEFFSKQLMAFPEYANTVIRQQVMTPIWIRSLEGEDLQYKVEWMDRQRKVAHDAAISAITAINRWSAQLGLEPFADIDTSDRYAVADFIGGYVGEIYGIGIEKSLDAITANKTMEYDTRIPSAQLQDIATARHEINPQEDPVLKANEQFAMRRNTAEGNLER